ncbi:MAG: beta-galactosidase [Lentisphaeria bacterium]|nr:beta-galactosidase [Lentisphaeria bacterium]
MTTVSIPRSEYPRPSFVKENWLNLNGLWEFELDQGDSGIYRGLLEKEYSSRILVPFCPESSLSGICNTDFLNAVWYRREVEIPEAWIGKRGLLHFQAVDFDATVWIDGKELYNHRGGFTPFTVDLGTMTKGKFTIVLRARDGKSLKPYGKQSDYYDSYGCRYTRTTGIWQTVWLEAVPDIYMKRPRITPNRERRRFQVEIPVSANRVGYSVRGILSADGKVLAEDDVAISSDFTPQLELNVPAEAYHEWEPGNPFLYDIRLELRDADGKVVESAMCYAGMRSVTIDGKRFLLNGKPLFQRLVLDQGYYPDGILTAPSDEALVHDIELSMQAGFNGARLHQKVFEERFLYHADRMGYLCWGEFGDWGFERSSEFYYENPLVCQPGATLVTQWLEALERDYSHPSIVGWCAINESGTDYMTPEGAIVTTHDVTRGAFLAAKATDRTRPVLDASGCTHSVRESDIYDCHDYEQDPEKFRSHFADLYGENKFFYGAHRNLRYNGQPFFPSEFGGIRWNPAQASNEKSWGYGEPPKSLEEFYERFKGLVDAVLDNPNIFGYCYTQLTDVFIEQNGICFFDRTLKFDMERLRKIQARKAAYEI